MHSPSALALVLLSALVPVVQGSVCLPMFGQGTPRVVAVASGGGLGTNSLGTPRDLQFHPLNKDELWVASASDMQSGGDNRLNGNFIIKKPGTSAQTTTLLRDRVAYHYMDNVAAFAFSDDGRALFTCQESKNPYMGRSPPNFFQGPTAFEVLSVHQSHVCKWGRMQRPGSLKKTCAGLSMQGRIRARTEVEVRWRAERPELCRNG